MSKAVTSEFKKILGSWVLSDIIVPKVVDTMLRSKKIRQRRQFNSLILSSSFCFDVGRLFFLYLKRLMSDIHICCKSREKKVQIIYSGVQFLL